MMEMSPLDAVAVPSLVPQIGQSRKRTSNADDHPTPAAEHASPDILTDAGPTAKRQRTGATPSSDRSNRQSKQGLSSESVYGQKSVLLPANPSTATPAQLRNIVCSLTGGLAELDGQSIDTGAGIVDLDDVGMDRAKARKRRKNLKRKARRLIAKQNLEEDEDYNPDVEKENCDPEAGSEQPSPASDMQPDPLEGDMDVNPDHIPNTGQDEHDDEVDETTVGCVLQAVSYLLSVKAQADALPPFVTVPVLTHDNSTASTVDQVRVVYDDGACVGLVGDLDLSLSDQTDQDEDYDEDDEQNLQTTGPKDTPSNPLTASFLLLRSRLASIPQSQETFQSLSSQNLPTSVRPGTFSLWKWTIQQTTPRSSHLAHLSTHTVLAVLRMVSQMMKRSGPISRLFGAWIWSLLARLPQVGSMASSDISIIREVGKRASWLLVGINRQKEQSQHVLINHITPIDQTDEPESEELAKAKDDLISKLSQSHQPDMDDHRPEDPSDLGPQEEPYVADIDTEAGLDAIIHVIGEIFGQRDLLEYRLAV